MLLVCFADVSHITKPLSANLKRTQCLVMKRGNGYLVPPTHPKLLWYPVSNNVVVRRRLQVASAAAFPCPNRASFVRLALWPV
jgi:hypothetical protein